VPFQSALLRCAQSVGFTCCPSHVRVQDPLVQRSVTGCQKCPLASSWHRHCFARLRSSRFALCVVAICIPIRAVFLRDPGRPAATSFTTSRTPWAAARRSRLLPGAGLPPPVMIVALGAAYRSVLSAAMHTTAGAREDGGADLRVREGAPLVEPKTRTAEASLPGVVAGLHTSARRSGPPALPLPVCANGRRHGVGVSLSTPRLVTFQG
jgi:hypothetical protein